MIIVKTKEEIELMRESALVVSKTLGEIAKEVKPGVTTLQLDKIAEECIRDQGAIPGFLGLYDFPNTLCMSPNEQVVHGIPNSTPLVEGDIISIDCGAIKNGFYGDHAYTFAIGEIDPEVEKLLQVTKESLYVGIKELKVGNRVGDVGYAIQQYCEAHGYGVVRIPLPRPRAISGILSAPKTITTINNITAISAPLINKNVACCITLQI